MASMLLWLIILLFAVAAALLWHTVARAGRPRLKPATPLRQDWSEEIAGEIAIPHLKPRPGLANPDLPEQYQRDRLVLLARDPYWLYAYWEITAARQEEFAATYGSTAWQRSRPVLRVYDVTGIGCFDGSNARSFTDIEIADYTSNWYINVGLPEHDYCVELGRLLPDGRFVMLLRSNIVTTPRAAVSSLTDEEWPPLLEVYKHIQVKTGLGSPLLVEEMLARLVEMQVSSPQLQQKPAQN